MTRLSSICAAVALAIGGATALAAQDRTLVWPQVDVQGHLDAAGRLSVRESQRIRFDGDWNGGERQFNIPRGQSLTLTRVRRVRADGDTVDLVQGDLKRTDEWKWYGESTLRWRSRLPTDPPFSGTEITYVLEYYYDGILQPDGDGLLLDHDFAFSDRSGEISAFTLALTIDAAWTTPPTFTGTYGPLRLPPGDHYVVTVPLRYAGQGAAPGVFYGADAELRTLLLRALLAVLALAIVRWLFREYARGRFHRPPSLEVVTPEWLEREVFVMRPEVAGAAWDDETSAPEVAATLARLVQEGKLTSTVKDLKIWIFTSHTLVLTIVGAKRDFVGYERELIDALFLPHEQTTDTDKVRARYKKTGFNPAAKIESGVEALVAQLTPTDAAGNRWRSVDALATASCMIVALVCAGLAMRERPGELAFLFEHSAFAVLAYGVAVSQAVATRGRVTAVMLHALRWLIPMAAGLSVLGPRILEGEPRASGYAWAAISALVLALCVSVTHRAATPLSPERVALRQRLHTARRWFRRELRRPEPALKDAWYPWLIGFGLGGAVDGWFKAFGGATASASSSRSIGSVSSSSSSGSGWTGFGGGGGFSGGGSSASFASAIGGMAASVSAPSSSGSSSSGGGSSGGGGGGGW